MYNYKKMSLNLSPLKCVKVLDPICNIGNEREYAILTGGAQVSYKPFTTTSIASTAIQWTCPPPSPQVIIDRKLYMQVPVRIVLTCSAPNANNILRPNYDAPRAFPLSGSINTMQVSINNTAVSINMSDIVHGLLHFNTDSKLKTHDYSMTCTCPDQSQNYSDLQGSIRNPLASYGDSNDESVFGRNSGQFTIVSNTPGQAVIDMILAEPLFLSPFYWGMSNAGGFYGVQNMDFNFTFVPGSAFRMWSHDVSGANAPGTISAGVFGFSNFTSLYNAPFSYATNVPVLCFKYITPKELQVIPKSITYPYFNIDRYPTDMGGSLAAGSATTLVSNNIQLKSIPRRIYIWARNNNATLEATPNLTDTYLGITGIRVNWNNYSGLLSNATSMDLYRMAIKNHCNLSWAQWSGLPIYQSGSFTNRLGGIGSLVCIEPGTDLGLSDIEAPGLLGTYAFQIELNVFNANLQNSVNPCLYIIVVSEGTMTIENQRSVTQVGVISKTDILESKESPMYDYSSIQCVNGGDFLSGLKQFGENVWSGVKSGLAKSYKFGKKVWPYVRSGLGVAKALAPLLLAAGKKGGAYAGGELVGECEEEYEQEPRYAPRHNTRINKTSGSGMVDRETLRKRLYKN